MTHRRPQLARVLAAAALALPVLAQAHPGHAGDAGFAAGVVHPLTGADHIVLLFAAGWLAARLAGRTRAALVALLAGLSGAAAAADSGAWSYVAGYVFTSACLIAAIAAVLIATRGLGTRVTAASARSPT